MLYFVENTNLKFIKFSLVETSLIKRDAEGTANAARNFNELKQYKLSILID